MKLCVLDERETWHGPLIAAAQARGWPARRIRHGHEADGPGLGFIRPHADPEVLPRNLEDDARMRCCLTMVQDRGQVEVYDNKSEQWRRWRAWMPPTWRFESEAEALDFVAAHDAALVSKADVGASSVNVRVLRSRIEQESHIRRVFGAGVEVDHCAGGRGGRRARSLQHGYVLLQQFIPHEVTWRVNIIGRSWAIFRRFNYPDRPVAQTGNVEPVRQLDPQTESLLAYCTRLVAALGTRWCALDILKVDHDEWRLLETSLAWPWPSPGDCMQAPFFGDTRRRWKEMWELLLDELEAGAFSGASGSG